MDTTQPVFGAKKPEKKPEEKPSGPSVFVSNDSPPDAEKWLAEGSLMKKIDAAIIGLDAKEAEEKQHGIADAWYDYRLAKMQKAKPESTEKDNLAKLREDSPIYIYFAWNKNRLVTTSTPRFINISLGTKKGLGSLALEFFPAHETRDTGDMGLISKGTHYGELYLLRQRKFCSDFASHARIRTPVKHPTFKGRPMVECWIEGGVEEKDVLRHMAYCHVKGRLLNLENRQHDEFTRFENDAIGSYWTEAPYVRRLAMLEHQEAEFRVHRDHELEQIKRGM